MIADLKATTFVWVAVAYGIASTALLPLSGCLAQVSLLIVASNILDLSYATLRSLDVGL